jgi:hypothetical protein
MASKALMEKATATFKSSPDLARLLHSARESKDLQSNSTGKVSMALMGMR